MAGLFDDLIPSGDSGLSFADLITQKPRDPRQNAVGKADAFIRGVADIGTFGLADEITAQAKSGPLSLQRKPDDYYSSGIFAGAYNPVGAIARALDAPFASDTKNADYDRALAEERATNASDAEHRGGYRLAGQLVGGVATGAGLARAGLSPTANAIEAGAGLGRVAATSAGEGAALGAAQGFGSGEGFGDRLQNAGVGVGVGGVLGLATPLAVSGASKVIKSVAAPILAPFYPENYAQDAIATAMRRSGRTPDEVGNLLQVAGSEGQPMYNVADALGYTGQRLASTVARNPSNERQAFVDALRMRQAGQGERLANALSEGFDAPDSAARVTTDLTDARTTEANRLYGAARGQATPVDITPVLDTIDRTLSPGVNRIANPRDNIAYDSIEGALSRVRNMMSDGRSNVTDFDTLFRAKLDLDDMIQRATNQGAGNKAYALSEVQRQLNNALADASPAYRTANDTFAQRSAVIDAIGNGSAAASPRQRSVDTIADFNALTPDQQQAYRVGYVDPLITRIESASMSPTTNKARMLVTPKLEQELPALAAPGRAQTLGNRIGREQRMFDTAYAALGGSKTADNIADALDMNSFDPTVMGKLARGDFIGATMSGLTKTLDRAQGMPPSVTERIARVLLETDPAAARQILTTGAQRLSRADALRAGVVSALLNSGAAGTGRLAAP